MCVYIKLTKSIFTNAGFGIRELRVTIVYIMVRYLIFQVLTL